MEQYKAYPWANIPVTINPKEVRSQIDSGWSSPYMPKAKPDAIETIPTVRAMNALFCNALPAIVSCRGGNL
jgi:hypothetical protein